MNITRKTKYTYAIGGLGKNIAYGFVASYTLYYYNTVLGISATFVGVLLMVARIFDAFNDPLMGVVVAKTKSRFGRYKPWILSGAILNALVLYAMFAVPEGLSGNGLKTYVTITYFLCGITYTLSDIPYWSIIPAITRPGAQRESLTVFARTLSGIGAALPTILVMSLLPLLGGGTDTENYRRGFALLALGISIFYVATAILTVRYLPGQEISEPQDASVKDLLNALFKNDQALNLAAIIILFNSAIYMTTNLLLYLFQYDIGDESQYTIFMVFSGLVQFAAMTVLYPLLRKGRTDSKHARSANDLTEDTQNARPAGESTEDTQNARPAGDLTEDTQNARSAGERALLSNRQIFLGACISAIIGYLLMTALIFGKNLTMTKMLLPGALISLANGFGYVLTTVFVADAVDYGESVTGQRQDSVVSSLQTLMVKLATSVASFVAGVGIDLTGLQINAEVQTQGTKMALRTLFAIPSLLFMTAALLIFIRKKGIGAE